MRLTETGTGKSTRLTSWGSWRRLVCTEWLVSDPVSIGTEQWLLNACRDPEYNICSVGEVSTLLRLWGHCLTLRRHSAAKWQTACSLEFFCKSYQTTCVLNGVQLSKLALGMRLWGNRCHQSRGLCVVSRWLWFVGYNAAHVWMDGRAVDLSGMSSPYSHHSYALSTATMAVCLS